MYCVVEKKVEGSIESSRIEIRQAPYYAQSKENCSIHSEEHETLESAQMWIRSKYGPVVEHDEDENEEFSLDNGAIESYRIL